MELKQDYASPRWTNEILDCSMPMTFDTYSKCSYHCLYCFSFYQKSHTLDGYDSNKNNIRAIRSVKPQKVIHLFESALSNDIENSSATEKTFFPTYRNGG